MNVSLEQTLLSWLSSFPSLPKIYPEMLSKINGELSLKIKSGPETVRKYVFGGEIKRAEFALRMRVSNSDTRSRMKAINILTAAGDFVKSGIASLSGITATDAGLAEYPKLYQRTDNGDDEYEGVYYIVFSEGSP